MPSSSVCHALRISAGGKIVSSLTSGKRAWIFDWKSGLSSPQTRARSSTHSGVMSGIASSIGSPVNRGVSSASIWMTFQIVSGSSQMSRNGLVGSSGFPIARMRSLGPVASVSAASSSHCGMPVASSRITST